MSASNKLIESIAENLQDAVVEMVRHAAEYGDREFIDAIREAVDEATDTESLAVEAKRLKAENEQLKRERITSDSAARDRGWLDPQPAASQPVGEAGDLTLPVDTAWLLEWCKTTIKSGYLFRGDVCEFVLPKNDWYVLGIGAEAENRLVYLFYEEFSSDTLPLGHVSTRQQFLDLYEGLSSGSLWPPKGE